MKKDDTVYLRHILDAIALIQEYFNVNYSIVWDTIRDDLPILKKSVKKILK